MLRNLMIIALLVVLQSAARAEDSLPDSVRKEFNSYVGVWVGVARARGGENTG